jgi:tRNA (guanine-N7-)-methyltransferase
MIIRPIRSYVLRQGKVTAGQRHAMEVLWPRYGLRVEDGKIACDEAILEIGFGNGASFLENAINHPTQQYIGVEVHEPGVGHLLLRLEEEKITNCRIYHHDAIDVLIQCIPDNSLKAILIFFPDPWHKTRHNKRRLIQPDFIALVTQKLKVGGFLHVATDWEDYAKHTLAVMAAQTQLINTAGDTHFIPRPETRPVTKYEQRGQRLGHGVWDMVFCKK